MAMTLNKCKICLDHFTYPVVLGCGHVFDLDCISSWYAKQGICPFDMQPINPQKVTHCPEALYSRQVTLDVDGSDGIKLSIIVNPHSSVLRLKLLLAKMAATGCLDIIQAQFMRAALPVQAKKWFLQLQKGKENVALHFDTKFTDYKLKRQKTYTVILSRKSQGWLVPCDHCYTSAEKSCSHTEE